MNNRGITAFNLCESIKSFENKNWLKYFILQIILLNLSAKTNKYLPKRKTTEKWFILSISNILKDINLMKKEIRTHDFKTKTLIKIADEFNIKEEFNWFNYKDFKI